MPASTWSCRISIAAAALAAGLPCAAQTTQRVSIDHMGGPSEKGVGGFHAISGDGSVVAFTSVSALVPDDTNQRYDIYVTDRSSGTVTRASVGSLGEQGSFECEYPSISADGRFVSFMSGSAEFVPNDLNAVRDIFLRDLHLGTTILVSVDDQGKQANDRSVRSSVSADGTRVAFDSPASNLVPGDGNGKYDVFVRDLVAGTTRRVSVSSAGLPGKFGGSNPLISADGAFVLFESMSDTFVTGDAGYDYDVFVHEIATGQTSRISMGMAGAEPDGPSFAESISADGRFVGFSSYASNLVPGDTNGVQDVFVHDRQLGLTERISVDSTGAEGPLESRDSHVSADGRLVAFESRSKSLAPGGKGEKFQVYLRDRLTGVTTREGVDWQGKQSSYWQKESRFPCLAQDGSAIAFFTYVSDLVSSDLNEATDILVRDLSGCAPMQATFCVASDTSIDGCQASVSTVGQPSLSNPASFRISSGAIPGGGVGFAYFGVEGADLTPLGSLGGAVCVGGVPLRAPLHTIGGSPLTCTGRIEYGLDEWLTAHPDAIGPGAVVHASFWFRDANSPDGFGLSDGVWFQVCP